MDKEKQKFLDLIIKKGLVTTAQVKELASTMKICRGMYLIMAKKLEVPITLKTFKGTTTKEVLLDSGATENFIDQSTVDHLKLGTKAMDKLVLVRNIDSTTNKMGKITQYTDLLVTKGNKKFIHQFFMTGLGGDRIIQGYPWLKSFNPDVDWLAKQILGPTVKLKTLLCGKYTQDQINQKWNDWPDPVIQATITEPALTFPEELVEATKKAVANITCNAPSWALS